jgi:SAM-dependent methyltransferase
MFARRDTSSEFENRTRHPGPFAWTIDHMERAPDAQDRRSRGQVLDAAAIVYEQFFVPALFAQWVDPMLDAAGAGPGDTVLDVGCGTGIVARAARQRVGPTGAVIGVDPNDGMLTVARHHGPEVDWRTGTAEALPCSDHEVDRTICQFAAMFFVDRALAVDEMVRVTRPGGRVAIATWAGVDRSPGYAAMLDLLARHVGDWAAAALSAPFAIGTEDALRRAIGDDRDGVSVTTRAGVARFASIDEWLHTDIRGWTLTDAIDDDAYAELLAVARSELARFEAPDGTIMFDAPAIIGVIEV